MGRGTVFTVELMWEETGQLCREFMQKLKKRGVRRAKIFMTLVNNFVSDHRT